LTFVPLHPARQRERGFNQAEKVAHALALGMGLPLIQGLARLRHTRAQVGLTEVVRRQNVDGAFGWRAGVAPPAGLALVDDVCTTGATLEAAAEAIAEDGGQISAFLVLGSPLRQPGYGLLRASGRPQTLPAPVVTSPE
jgi:predicted amidophosphoribosyltransferase